MNPNVAKVEDAVRRSRPGGEIRGVKCGLRLSSAEVKL